MSPDMFYIGQLNVHTMLLKSDRTVAFGQPRTGSRTTLRPRTFTY